MKKLIISILLLILFNNAYSQKFYLTPKAGITLAKQSNTYKENHRKLGLTFGVALEYNITKRLSLQSELNYVQKGYLEKGQYHVVDPNDPVLINSDYKLKISYNYLEIPVSIKVNFGNKKFKFYGYTGPSFAYLLNENSNLVIYHFDLSNKDKLNFGWQVGTGCKLFLFGPGAMVFDIKYDGSISKLYKDSSPYNPRNNYFAFNVGYAFPLGKK